MSDPRRTFVHDDPFKKRLPYPLRVRGSVTFKILPQVLMLTVFSTVITSVSELVPHVNLGVSNILTSTLGFIVSLCLSFRTTSSYARWWEGRTAWEKLHGASRNIGRLIWIHAPEKEAADILRKKTAINLLVAFCVSLKNHLREERGDQAEHIRELIPHLRTYAYPSNKLHTSHSKHAVFEPHPHDTQAAGTLAHGNLPIQISYQLSSYIHFLKTEQNLDAGVFAQLLVQMNTLTDVCGICERILRTPLPLAFNIVISQMVYVFMLVLPFQLQLYLHWLAIPATFVTACLLFGMAEIGLEIENPWGTDANDLDLERYTQAIALELDTITSIPPPTVDSWIHSDRNMPLFPARTESFNQLVALPIPEVRELLTEKVGCWKGTHSHGHGDVKYSSLESGSVGYAGKPLAPAVKATELTEIH